MSCVCLKIAKNTRAITYSNDMRSNAKQYFYLHYFAATWFVYTSCFGYIWGHRTSCAWLKIAKTNRKIPSSHDMRSNVRTSFSVLVRNSLVSTTHLTYAIPLERLNTAPWFGCVVGGPQMQVEPTLVSRGVVRTHLCWRTHRGCTASSRSWCLLVC
jgi:hypothetical protein